MQPSKLNFACLLPVLILAVSAPAGADVNPAGKVFLLDYGARASAVGGCGTLLGEAYSGLYNPAAQTLNSDLSGAIYANPHPYFVPGYGFLAAAASARTEFGYIAFSYLYRKGVDGSELPPEEAAALVLAGNPWKSLSAGIGLKILTTKKANFVALNEPLSDTYKMAFDLGVVYSEILPQLSLHSSRRKVSWIPWFGDGFRSSAAAHRDRYRWKYGRHFPRGFSVGIALQNLGGRIDYDYAIDIEMLPQTFRADLLWGIYQGGWWDLRAAGQLQKLLVSLNESGGYQKAAAALLQAWGGGSGEGGWTSRLGLEITAFCLLSGRIGWSRDHGAKRSFAHIGLGLGPEWLRLNFALKHEPGSNYDWFDSLRLDLAVNVTFEKVRSWTNID